MEDLLCVLMAVTVANKRIVSNDIEAFMGQSAKLQVILKIDPKWSEAKTLVWYEMNKDGIRGEALGPDLETWLYARANRLAEVENKAAILEAMRQISRADGEIHVSETALIVLIARHWVLYPEGNWQG